MSVKILIEDGPATPDYDGGNRGWRAEVVIDPSRRVATLESGMVRVYTPDLWAGRACSVEVPPAVACEAVRDFLSGEYAQEILSAVCDTYKGTRYDGREHVGVWKMVGSFTMAYYPLLEKLRYHLWKLPVYWHPAQWVGREESEIKSLASHAESLEELSRELLAEASAVGVYMLEEDMLGYLRALREKE